MAATPEKKVKQAVEAVLKSEDVYYFFPATHGYGRSGIPDIIACVKSIFLAIECKAEGNRPTALQVREINRIRAAGGIAVVIDETNIDKLPSLIWALKDQTTIMGDSK